MKSAVLALIAIATLTACGGMGTVMERYGSVKAVAFQHGGSTWRVFDKPEEGRLMLTPSIGDSAAAGAIEGVTLGMADNPLGPNKRYSDAATAWILRHGGTCRLTAGRVILHPQFEFDYSC